MLPQLILDACTGIDTLNCCPTRLPCQRQGSTGKQGGRLTSTSEGQGRVCSQRNLSGTAVFAAAPAECNNARQTRNFSARNKRVQEVLVQLAHLAPRLLVMLQVTVSECSSVARSKTTSVETDLEVLPSASKTARLSGLQED